MGALGVMMLVLLLLSSILMIVLILMQAGRGGGLSGAFGVGGDTSIFGAQTASVITKATAILAAIFMVSCIALAAVEKHRQLDTVDFSDDLGVASDTVLDGTSDGDGSDESGMTTGEDSDDTDEDPGVSDGESGEPESGPEVEGDMGTEGTDSSDSEESPPTVETETESDDNTGE